MDGNPLLQLRSQGQSVWLDDLHRRMLNDGTLARLIESDGVVGLTSNPAIFAAAMTTQEEYARAAADLLGQCRDGVELYETLALEDVVRTADLLKPVYDRSGGRDGFVSFEVSPHLAHDTAATVNEARRLWNRIARPNVMIKVPGTEAGVPAIQSLIAEGINVNITLLFSPTRYSAVAEAYMAGLEERLRQRQEVSRLASVASFFISRIDTLVDRSLDKLAGDGREDARELRGRIAAACACRAYDRYLNVVASDRWRALVKSGARSQRLLWASTSTKDPTYRDVRYVEELIAPDTVTTLPMATLVAYRDHGRIGSGLGAHCFDAGATIERLAALGIDIEEVARQLEAEGVRKFVEPFDQLQSWLELRRPSKQG